MRINGIDIGEIELNRHQEWLLADGSYELLIDADGGVIMVVTEKGRAAIAAAFRDDVPPLDLSGLDL